MVDVCVQARSQSPSLRYSSRSVGRCIKSSQQQSTKVRYSKYISCGKSSYPRSQKENETGDTRQAAPVPHPAPRTPPKPSSRLTRFHPIPFPYSIFHSHLELRSRGNKGRHDVQPLQRVHHPHKKSLQRQPLRPASCSSSGCAPPPLRVKVELCLEHGDESIVLRHVLFEREREGLLYAAWAEAR